MKMLQLEKKSLNTRLWIGYGLCLLITLIIGVLSIKNLNLVRASTQQIYNMELVGIVHLKDANINLILMGRSLRQMMLAQDAAQREKARADLDKATLQVTRCVADARKCIFRKDNILRIDQFDIEFDHYKRNVAQAVSMLDKEAVKTSEAGAFVNSDQFMTVINKADSTLDEIVKSKLSGAEDKAKEVDSTSKEITIETIAGLLFALVVSGIAGVVIGGSIRNPLEKIRQSIENLSSGKLDEVIPYASFTNELGAFSRSIKSLQDVYRSNEEQRWVKASIAEISSKLQGLNSFIDLAREVITTLTPMIGAGCGVFYHYSEEKLRHLASYGFRERKRINNELKIGEGLVGQCALEKSPITLTDPPVDYIKISSGLGETVPRVIAVLPILHTDQLIGVIELASFKPFGNRETLFLDALMPTLGMTMQIIDRNIRTQQLLAETKLQAERMESQAAKLEEQSVELEAQQAELSQAETWFRSIIESAPDGLFVIDEHGSITLTNIEAAHIFSYDSSELIGISADNLIAGSGRKKYSEARLHFMTSNENRFHLTESEDMFGKRKDGTEINIDLTFSRLPAIGGRGVCICITIRDVTERKKLESKARASEERNRQILDATAEGIFGVDAQGHFTFLNASVTRMLGYSSEELMGKGNHAIIHHHHPDGRVYPLEECPMYAAYKFGKTSHVDNECLWRKDGSMLLVEYRATPIVKEGNILGAVISFTDITERKKLESKLAAAKTS